MAKKRVKRTRRRSNKKPYSQHKKLRKRKKVRKRHSHKRRRKSIMIGG